MIPSQKSQPQQHQQKPIQNHVVVFVGGIGYPATKNLRSTLCQLVGNGAREIILHFSSQGGSVFEALTMYNFLRSLPVKLSIHNIGCVESCAVMIFMAAKQRTCSPESRFMFHSFDWTYGAPQTLTTERMGEHALSLSDFQSRLKSILKSNAPLSDEHLDRLQIVNQATIVDAASAKEIGLVQDVKEASIPAGYAVWHVEF